VRDSNTQARKNVKFLGQ